MKVTLDGTHYVVWFEYGVGRVPHRKGFVAVPRTTAKLGIETGQTQVKNGRTVPVVALMLDAFTDCAPDDQFVKAKGRKVALTRLVRRARLHNPAWQSYTLRQAFWEAAFAAMPSLRS